MSGEESAKKMRPPINERRITREQGTTLSWLRVGRGRMLGKGVGLCPTSRMRNRNGPSKPKEKTRARKKRKHLNGRLSPCYLKSFSFTPPETSTPSVSVHSVHT